MLDFSSDYARGCHQEILSALAKTNDQSFPGYGADELCARATQLIRDACACPEASVIFLEGGTQTNQIASKMLLRPWQGIVAAETAHVATHEAGAIEHAGHKVLTLPAHDGKISAAAVTTCLEAHAADENREHMVEPRSTPWRIWRRSLAHASGVASRSTWTERASGMPLPHRMRM